MMMIMPIAAAGTLRGEEERRRAYRAAMMPVSQEGWGSHYNAAVGTGLTEGEQIVIGAQWMLLTLDVTVQRMREGGAAPLSLLSCPKRGRRTMNSWKNSRMIPTSLLLPKVQALLQLSLLLLGFSVLTGKKSSRFLISG